MLRRKKECRERAIGIAYEMNALQFERVEQGDEIPGLDDGRVIWSLRIIVRIVITPAVVEDAVMLGEWFYLSAPFSIVAEAAVDQDHWNAASALEVMKLYSIDSCDL
jgi:hypothetical protein